MTDSFADDVREPSASKAMDVPEQNRPAPLLIEERTIDALRHALSEVAEARAFGAIPTWIGGDQR